MGYDRAITIFSPDGRLYQVEYAMEAVRKGWNAIGVKGKEGVVLVAERRSISPLTESTEKILKVDEHIGVTFSGFFADARILIDKAREYAQIHRILYDEPIGVELLAKRVCDILQAYTQHGGVRPFGVALLIAGIDSQGAQLVGTEPSGAYVKYYAHAIGSGASDAIRVLEKGYKPGIRLEESVILALSSLKVVMSGELTPESVEIAIVDVRSRKFRKLTMEEKGDFISKIK